MTLIFILTILSAVVPARAEKSKLLDGEIIEEGQPAPSPAPAQPAPENNTSQTVILLKEFSVTLPANPSTGLGWKVAKYDREFLQLLRRRYQKPDQRSSGATGQEFFDFLPLKSGSTNVFFHYKRIFKTQVARELKHTIVIK